MVKKTIIPATKKLGKELIKDASWDHKLFSVSYRKKEQKLVFLYRQVKIFSLLRDACLSFYF